MWVINSKRRVDTIEVGLGGKYTEGEVPQHEWMDRPTLEVGGF